MGQITKVSQEMSPGYFIDTPVFNFIAQYAGWVALLIMSFAVVVVVLVLGV